MLLLMGLIAAAVSLSLHGPSRSARMDTVLEQVKHFDRVIREHARRFDEPVQILFELDTGTIRAVDAVNQRPRGMSFTLPADFKLEQVRTHQEQTSRGQAAVPCSSHGLTPSYAIAFGDPDAATHWVLFSGLTGQMQRVDNDQQIQQGAIPKCGYRS